MYIPNDKFAQRARKEGYRARSAYKLLDIQEKFRILKAGDFVLDLGAAPGSWTQVASKVIGGKGKILGVDQARVAPFDNMRNIKILESDIFVPNLLNDIQEYFGGKVDVILSDVAPATTGLRERDQAVSYELAARVLEIALAILKKDGNAVIKVFESKDTPLLVRQARKHFFSVKTLKPVGSQKNSKELYIVAQNFMR